MLSALAERTTAFPDLTSFVAELGKPPAALAKYDDNTLVRNRDGLSATFSFTGCLETAAARDVLRYCAGAFNQFGFAANAKQADFAEPQYDNGSTSITLRIPVAGIPKTIAPEVRQYDQERRVEFVESSDAPGPLWYALRTIRQAAKLA